MPSPYTEPVSLLYLAAVGKGSTSGNSSSGGLIKTASQANVSPITLSGSPQVVAVLVENIVTGEKVLLRADISCQGPSSGNGNLIVNFNVDGSPVGPANITFPFTSVADGVAGSFQLELSGLTLGPRSFGVSVEGTGDGGASMSIAAGAGILSCAIVSV